MKFNLLILLTFLSLFSNAGFTTEYVYRDLMGNTLPPPKCEAQSKAVARAAKTSYIKRYSKKFCQTQGYGWHFTEVKNTGNSVCDECNDSKDKYRCHLEDMVVQCKRLKPGTAGMLPGKS